MSYDHHTFQILPYSDRERIIRHFNEQRNCTTYKLLYCLASGLWELGYSHHMIAIPIRYRPWGWDISQREENITANHVNWCMPSRCSIPQRTLSKAIAGSSFGSRGRCGTWFSSAMLALIIVVIVFIVSRAPDLVLLVKKLLGVSGWYSDVWCQSVEVGSVKKGGVWLPVLRLRHLCQCQTSTPTSWT